MKIENVDEARELLTAARQVMSDALRRPTGKSGAGIPLFNHEGRDAAEVLARRLAITDELGQALLDELKGGTE